MAPHPQSRQRSTASRRQDVPSVWLKTYMLGFLSGVLFGSNWPLLLRSLPSDANSLDNSRLGIVCRTSDYPRSQALSQGDDRSVAPRSDSTPSRKSGDILQGSLAKLQEQWSPQEISSFNRSNPIYIDIGMSDGADTKHHLSQGYSVVSVDAFLPWIDKGKTNFAKEIADHRLLLFNVGVGVEESASMPLYYKDPGSVIASFVKEKGCQNHVRQGRECFHTDVPVVRCEAILELIGVQAQLFKVDVEMMHHSCVRSLHHVETALLPKYVCWEEHDKPFNQAVVRPITDTKLILGMFELGYTQVKIVMQGPKAARFYGIRKSEAGFGQGSGTQTPEEMMHYRSYEDNGETAQFDTNWRTVDQVLRQGVFGPGGDPKPRAIFEGNSYYDICMKLSPQAATERTLRGDPKSFPLASYASSK